MSDWKIVSTTFKLQSPICHHWFNIFLFHRSFFHLIYTLSHFENKIKETKKTKCFWFFYCPTPSWGTWAFMQCFLMKRDSTLSSVSKNKLAFSKYALIKKIMSLDVGDCFVGKSFSTLNWYGLFLPQGTRYGLMDHIHNIGSTWFWDLDASASSSWLWRIICNGSVGPRGIGISKNAMVQRQ